MTLDRIPYVGRLSRSMKRVFVATGFGGWGMTNGTASAMLLSDLIQGRANPWKELYTPRRAQLLPNVGHVISEGAQAAAQFVGGHLRPGSHDIAAIAPGDARIIQQGLQEAGGLSRSERQSACGLANLHTPQMCRAVEQRRDQLGLSLPRIALWRGWAGVGGAGAEEPRDRRIARRNSAWAHRAHERLSADLSVFDLATASIRGAT